MSRANKILGRILIGSAIGAVLGLILLAMGIAVVLNALESRSSSQSRGLEIQVEDHEQGYQPADPWEGAPAEDEDRSYDDDDYAYDHDTVPYREDTDRQDRERDSDYDRRDPDEAYDHLAPRYPGQGAAPPPVTVPRRVEPLPPASRSQWRSIFEEDASAPSRSQPRPASPAPQATTPAPAPRTHAAPPARPAPRPSQPRAAPEAKKDEESLFY